MKEKDKIQWDECRCHNVQRENVPWIHISQKLNYCSLCLCLYHFYSGHFLPGFLSFLSHLLVLLELLHHLDYKGNMLCVATSWQCCPVVLTKLCLVTAMTALKIILAFAPKKIHLYFVQQNIHVTKYSATQHSILLKTLSSSGC